MEQETVMKKTLLTTLAVASSLAFACVANASENNPFGLVYKGAIMENVKGKVNIHPVTLYSERPENCGQRLHSRRI